MGEDGEDGVNRWRGEVATKTGNPEEDVGGEKQEAEAAMDERVQLLGLYHGPGLWILDLVDVREAEEASRAHMGSN